MKTLTYILTYIAFLAIGTGIIFKIQHWPGADIQVTSGYILSFIAGVFLLIHKVRSNKKTAPQKADSIQSKDSIENILDA